MTTSFQRFEVVILALSWLHDARIYNKYAFFALFTMVGDAHIDSCNYEENSIRN